MKTESSKRVLTLLLAGALAALTPQWTMAAGTPACTPITNTALVDYKVGTVDQPQGSGVAPSFLVGNKVMVTVEKKDAAAVPVVTNGSAAQLVAASSYLTFTVTNAGNALQDYTLSASALVGADDPFGGAADSFDLSGVTAYVDVNNNLTYDAGDTATTLLAVNPDTTYGANAAAGTRTVFVVPTGASPVVLAAQANGTQSVYALEAVSNKGNGSADSVETNSNGTIYKIGGGTCTADIVLAEDTHTSNVAGELKWDGKDNARNTFKVGTAVLTIEKTATTIWDPVNYDGLDAKSIPGALVRYVITIENGAGAASAKLTTISDTLVASLVMDPDLKTNFATPATPAAESAAGSGFKAMVTGGTRAGDSSGLADSAAKYYTTTSSVDGIDLSGQLITATLATILPADAGGGSAYEAGELKAGETLTITFNAVIQ